MTTGQDQDYAIVQNIKAAPAPSAIHNEWQDETFTYYYYFPLSLSLYSSCTRTLIYLCSLLKTPTFHESSRYRLQGRINNNSFHV